jgi:drug/metabolite transporter (DMT)-like permease
VSQRVGLAAAAFTGLQVGAAMVATRALGGEPGPATLALLRYAVALAVLAVPLMRMRWVPVPRSDLAPLVGLGILQFGLLIALLNWGLTRVPAGQGALLFATMPMMALGFAAALGREALSPAKIAGAVLTLAGVAVTLGPTGQGDPSGILAVLGAAAWGAVAAGVLRA